MKLLKKLDTKNNKVVLGLFALLFVVTAVHTNAILGLSLKSKNLGGQTAQVLSSNQNCLEVTPGYNYVSIRNNIDSPQTSTDLNKIVTMVFNVKNICSSNVYVVHPESINRITTPGFAYNYTSMQILGWQNTPQTITLPNQYFTQPATDFLEILGSLNSQQIFETMAPNVSTLATSRVSSSKLEPNQTREFLLQNRLPFNSNLPPIIRLTVNNLKWFNQAAIQDNLIVPKEIKTYNFDQSLQNAMATDFMDIYNGCDCGEDGENIKLDVNKITNPFGEKSFTDVMEKEKSSILRPSPSLR